jgi:hypothetical protein
MANEGKAYDNLYLSDLEQKIIDAHRNGAHITVTYYDESNYEEATDKVMEFGNIKTIRDLGSATAFGIHDYSKGFTVKAYIDK